MINQEIFNGAPICRQDAIFRLSELGKGCEIKKIVLNIFKTIFI